jgi:hypothetical protein
VLASASTPAATKYVARGRGGIYFRKRGSQGVGLGWIITGALLAIAAFFVLAVLMR